MSSMNSDISIRSVVVVGGGTSGWLAANHLAKKLQSKDPAGVKVTLVESRDIPTVGVGEGTVPAIRETLRYLGISETQFIRECDATFKQSIKFVDWLVEPQGSHNYYHHLFDYPNINSFNTTPYWLLGDAGPQSYADSVSIQGVVCDRGLGPKTMIQPEFEGVTSYAYHLDAAKFGQLLARHAINNLGVTHQAANVKDAILDDEGNITSLVTSDGQQIEGDFFVDCSGFSSILLGKKMNVPFVDKGDILFVDRALALQVPYPDGHDAIPCFTTATARTAGWIWDIGLPSRRGTGYVYSSKYMDDEIAERDFREYLGSVADGLDVRQIAMRIGYREKFWQGNCVAIGLSQGFVEPLEATGILMFDATARMLAELFPASKESIELTAKRFNANTRHAWDKVIDFLKLHYYLSQRQDSEFWIDNRRGNSISDALQSDLERWRSHVPCDYDFTSISSIFNLENYLYVLYGMNFRTDLESIRYRYPDNGKARDEFSHIKQLATQAERMLLPHRELIERIRKYGLQTI